ncbi:hypothetical protein [Steroidobacter cummioxidans]|uniref:hypothetical protein n=1 Tax=Steroidobacter cummioxidans TaxID=1803913 RepID=UPI000E3175D0|nr:hypothetical protein [Steroidobacter cummioxidans]
MFERLFTHPLWAYRTGTFAFASAWPLGLLISSILVAAALVAWSLWRRRALGWRLLWPVGVLQTLLLALVLCLLWRPVLNVERVRDRENELAIAIDASASMAYGDAGQSRLQEVARRLCRNGTMQSGWKKKSFAVRMFGFAQTTTPLKQPSKAMPPPRPADAHRRIALPFKCFAKCAGSAPLSPALSCFSDGARMATH